MDMATKMRHVALKIEQEAATRPIIQANTLADASSTLKTLKMMSSPPAPSETASTPRTPTPTPP